jgi:tetratricopeptide (TPR) repeat protein
MPFVVPIAADVVVAAPSCGTARRDAWDRARAPALARFCDLVARAEASVDTDPARAATAAIEADRALPGRSLPLVLQARAAIGTGQFAEGVELMRKARAVDANAGTDAASLLALAIAQDRTSDATSAAASYRRLVPVASALPPLARTRARVLAGLAILAEGPTTMAEALAVLREAESGAVDELAPLAKAALALALDRSGAVAESRALVATAGGPGALRANEPGLRRLDALALAAMLREAKDPTAGAAAWETFVAAAGGSPWTAHARGRVAELRRGPRGGKR